MQILPNSSKRQKLEISGSPVPLCLALNGLSREQLLSIINDVASKHPELKRVCILFVSYMPIQMNPNTVFYIKIGIGVFPP